MNLSVLGHDPAAPLLFTSGTFFLFFSLFLVGYLAVFSRRRLKLAYVLIFSGFYYYKCNGVFVGALAFTTVLDFAIARRLKGTASRTVRRRWVALSVLANVAVLGYFKYTNFILGSLATLRGEGAPLPLDIFLPIGISFYTFQSIAYVVDVHRGDVEPTTSLLEYAFFLSFFPQIVAGPIVRAAALLPQIRDRRAHIDAHRVRSGLFLVITGLAKKAIVADTIGIYVDLVFGQPAAYRAPETWLAVYGYALQIFFDFSGYSDMAVGMARILGFDLPENFRQPYRARNITEFWQRWHITLSRWLRDYVYIPLGGNRRGAVRRYRNLMLTMLIGGLWHGAAWNFVVWGGLHGLALVVHKLVVERGGAAWRPRSGATRRAISWSSTVATFHFVGAAWVLFRAPTFARAGDVFRGLVGPWPAAAETWTLAQARANILLAVGVGGLLAFVPSPWFARAERWFIRAPWAARTALFLLCVQGVVQLADRDVQPFIYFQF
ncbi:MAG: MBOAT family protein [Myxococcota bacterium]